MNPAPTGTRDPRPLIYAAFDLAMAALYAVIFIKLIPNRHGFAQALFWAIVVTPGVMAAAMIARSPRTWTAAVAACIGLLALAVTFLVLAVSSAALLAGVYGSLGRAGAAITLAGAALVIELLALLPAFQLKFLMTRAGRRAFGKHP